MAGSAGWLTRANALTLLRLLAAPLLAAAIGAGAPGMAALVFLVAAGTDLADGWVARRFGEASALGGLADHAADAAFVTVGTAALAATGVLPPALPVLIALAFLQYALEARPWAAPGSSGLRPSTLGRCNGIAYYVIVAVPLVRDALGWSWPGAGLVMALGWALTVSTVLSIGDRLRRLAAARRARGSPV